MKRGVLACCVLGAMFTMPLVAQTRTHHTTRPAVADAFATEPGGFLLAIPGVADDFVLFADGQWVDRGDGTARLSALLRRQSEVDRQLFLELEFTGGIRPGQPGHPPLGSPVTTLLPAAYAPNGPCDPTGFAYFTAVTGTLVGLRSYGGLAIAITGAGATQLGTGANNRNVEPGLAVDLNLQVQTPPTLLPFQPTGPASLRATLTNQQPLCATHVDADPVVAGGAGRAGLTAPGLASDYLFLPVGEFTEAADGTATLRGTLRRQQDYGDRWACDLTFTGRVERGDPTHPPAPGPVQNLLASAYAASGGPIDPAAWRYYTGVLGALVGEGDNQGGVVAVVQSTPAQCGLGAGQGNLHFGLQVTLVPSVVSQPATRTVTFTGDLLLQSNLGTACILPEPQIVQGASQALPNVTDQPAVYTGIDLGWCEQVAIGPTIVASPDPRHWFAGNLQVIDHQTVHVHVPQGMPVGTYPLRLLDRTNASAQLSLQLVTPNQPTLRTESSVLPGEDQHWVVAQGPLVGPVLGFILLSPSPLPSVLPGQVSLQVGNQFSELLVFNGMLHDPVSGLLVVTIPGTAAFFAGSTLYSQAVLVELLAANPLPLPTTDRWTTNY